MSALTLLAVCLAGQSTPPRFTVEKLVARDSHSVLAFGPDGHLYATTTAGDVWRYRLDGTSGRTTGEERVIAGISPSTAINGFAFAPGATSSDLLAYVTAIDFANKTGRVYRCRFKPWGQSSPLLEKTLLVDHIGLMGNHAVNHLRFGRDGLLYVNLAGQHHSGFEPVRHSAALVQMDLKHAAFGALPVDIRGVDVTQSTAPIRLFATGLRNPHGLCLHSNGDFYATTHDPFDADDVPDPVNGVDKIHHDLTHIPDFLVRLKKGKYYGHPNPTRGEFVSYGGNPTSGKDPYEMAKFPIGTRPLPGYDVSLIQGTGNHMCIAGVAEYTDGHLLVAYLRVNGANTGRVEWFRLDSTGGFTGRGGYVKDQAGNVIVFNGVLDVAVTSRGWVYVADFGTRSGNGGASGTGSIKLLKPATGNLPPSVSITAPANGAAFTTGQNVTLRAAASDPDGAVAQVAFLLNGVERTPADTTGGDGYTYAWVNVQPGTYEIRARARDNAGATTLSEPVTAVVDAAKHAPAITTAPPTAAYVGSSYAYDVDATGTPVPAYSLDTKPSGMAIDAATGRIAWTPAAAGGFDVVVRAANGVVPDATQGFRVQVQALRPADFPLGAVSGLVKGVEYAYYELPPMDFLPRFDGLTAAGAGTRANVSLDGARADSFAFRFNGFVEVPADGTYTFSTASDDGSRLYVGAQVVVDNDGVHAIQTKSGSIGLKAGKHAWAVEYFERAGGQSLTVSWSGPGVSGAIPDAALYRPATPYGLDVRVPVKAYLNMPSSESGLIPAALSGTGAFSDTANLALAPGAVPFKVNSPLWSDGAAKSRWLFVPSGAAMGFSPAGNWTYPPGSVFVKHFALGARRLETRLNVVKADGSIYGVAYKWRSDDSDADRVDAGFAESVNGQSWFFPGPQDCLQCHTPAAGWVLGPRTRQLNGDFLYASTGKTDNQLRTLAWLGLIAPAPANGSSLDRLAPLDDLTATLEHRARSYIDSNCAHCHQPGGVNSNWDGRFDTPLDQQGLVDAPALNGLGLADAKLVAPGDPASSILHKRMDSRVAGVGMPPLASSLKDEEALRVLSDWIRSLGPAGSTASTGGDGDGDDGGGRCGALGLEFLLPLFACRRFRR